MVEKIFMSIKQQCNDILIMLLYKFIDSSKILYEFEDGFRWSDVIGFKFPLKKIRFLEIWLVMTNKIFGLRCRDYLA